MAIIVVDDLIFRSKIQAAAAQHGTPVQTPGTSADALASLRASPGELVLIDLHHAGLDALELIKALRSSGLPARLIGFCSHVDAGLAAGARDAGCDLVLPRSEFVRQLPGLLQGSPA